MKEGIACATAVAVPGEQEWYGRMISSLSSLLYDDVPPGKHDQRTWQAPVKLQGCQACSH